MGLVWALHSCKGWQIDTYVRVGGGEDEWCLHNRHCACVPNFPPFPTSTATHPQLSSFLRRTMQGRPTSSARPSTSARPGTAFDRDQFQQRLQPQQPQEIEEEYEEESDDEDVFAFLPPTTADQQQQSHYQQSDYVQYPQPAFDPWGRQYPSPPIYPSASSKNPFAIDPSISLPPQVISRHPSPPGIHDIPSPKSPYPHNQASLPPPSPSTDSHPSTGMTGPDFFRLKRLGTAVSSKLAVVDDNEKEKDPERVEEGVSALGGRGTRTTNQNLNALPYKMYNQQASSYYGRDVRTGSAVGSDVGMWIFLFFSFLFF